MKYDLKFVKALKKNTVGLDGIIEALGGTYPPVPPPPPPYPRRISIDDGGLICTINEDLTLTDKSGTWLDSQKNRIMAQRQIVGEIIYVYFIDFRDGDLFRYNETDFIIEKLQLYNAEWI